ARARLMGHRTLEFNSKSIVVRRRAYLPTEDPQLFSHWLAILMFAVASTSTDKPGRLAAIGDAPHTRLVDSNGRPFDLAKLRGKVVLVSFVFTTCSGVCPATTQTLVRVQRTLQEAKLWRTSVEFVSITLDPKRDTPEVLSRYGQLFGADLAAWHYLT